MDVENLNPCTIDLTQLPPPISEETDYVTGLEMLRYDLDGDGKTDVWVYYQINTTNQKSALVYGREATPLFVMVPGETGVYDSELHTCHIY